MKVIHLEASQELQAAKNAMFRSLVTLFICYLLSVVPVVGLIASVAMLVATVWYFIGVYKISKLTNSSLFQSHMFMVLITLVLVLAMIIVVATQGEVEAFFIGVVGVVYIIDILLVIWLFWKICTEFSALTNLRQFMIAFKFYIGSFFLSVIGIVMMLMAIDLSLVISIFKEALVQESSYMSQIDTLVINSSLVYVSLLIFALTLVSTILSFVFYLLGIAKITNVSVKEQRPKSDSVQ